MKKKFLIAASLTALLLTACNEDTSNVQEVKVDFQETEQSLNEKHNYLNKMTKLADSTVLIDGQSYDFTVKDFKEIIYSEDSFSAAYLNEMLNFLVTTVYQPEETEIQQFIAEQANYNKNLNNANELNIREKDAYIYISLLKAANETFVISDEEKQKFYETYYDRATYPTIEDVPDIDKEIMFSKLMDPISLYQIYSNVLEKNITHFEFNNFDIEGYDAKLTLQNFIKSNGENKTLPINVAKILLGGSNDAQFVLNHDKDTFTLGDVKRELAYLNAESAFSRFLIFDSFITKYIDYDKDDLGLKALDNLWSDKFSNYDTDSLNGRMYKEFVFAYYKYSVQSGNVNDVVLKKFHQDSQAKFGDSYFYNGVNFEDILRVDLAHELFLQTRELNITSELVNSIDFKAFNFYDENILNLVKNH